MLHTAINYNTNVVDRMCTIFGRFKTLLIVSSILFKLCIMLCHDGLLRNFSTFDGVFSEIYSKSM